MLRLILVDDEALARQRLCHLLAGRDDVVLVGEAESVSGALRLLERERPDGMLLDIAMADGTGFDVLARLADPPGVVFVTATAHHAVDAFAVRAIDYLLKPVRESRLEEALQRLHGARAQARSSVSDEPPEMFHLRMPGRSLSVPRESVVLLSAERDYTRIVLDGRAPLLVRQPLGRSAAELPVGTFCRLGRSLVINLNRLCEIDERARAGTAIRLAGWDEIVLLGRAASEDLRRALSCARGHCAGAVRV